MYVSLHQPRATSAIALCLFLHRRGARPKPPQPAEQKSQPSRTESRQSGSFDPTQTADRQIEIFYSKRFKHPPTLSVELEGALGKIRKVAQRPDGFLVEIPSLAYGGGSRVRVNRTAEGEFEATSD